MSTPTNSAPMRRRWAPPGDSLPYKRTTGICKSPVIDYDFSRKAADGVMMATTSTVQLALD